MKTYFKLSKEQIIRMNKAASREAELELGLLRPKHKIHKSVKDYTRKSKHKVKFV